ncbi:MAG: hypothetical protein ACOC7J_04910, partial [Armatimonadota bacterium]
ELEELLEPATVAPMPHQQFDTIVLMLLEAGVVDDEDTPHLDWDNLPDMPEDMSDRDCAQLLAFEAYEICFEAPDEALELADEALEIDELCIDARAARWFAFDIEDEEALTAAGVAAVLGHEMILNSGEFREYDDVWMYPRMRGAVRGYAELALTNWAHGNRKKAIEAARETLSMAPDDPLRMAPHLANWCLTLGYPDRARRVFRDFGRREIAPVAYAEALMEFIKEGPGLKAKSKLLKATRANPLIMAYLGAELSGIMDCPESRFPSHVYMKGTLEEVMVWYDRIAEAWEATDGALEWAAQCFDEPRFRREVKPAIDVLIAEVEEAGLIPDDLEDESWNDEEDGGPELRLL